MIALGTFACQAVVNARRSGSTWWVAASFVFATVWFGFPQLGRRLRGILHDLEGRYRRLREQRRLASRAATLAELRANEEGVTFLRDAQPRVVPWNDIVQVELYWVENAWGDPQFGRYSDFYWRIAARDSRAYSIDDSDVNRFVLLPALATRLPGYAFVYQRPRAGSWDRSIVCWQRSAQDRDGDRE